MASQAPNPSPFVNAYPRCSSRRLITAIPVSDAHKVHLGHHVARVKYETLQKQLTTSELESFDRWHAGSTVDEYGIYPWDVERWLSGLPNID